MAVTLAGATHLLEVPYALLLEEWFDTLPADRLEHLGDYYEHFDRWLTGQVGMFSSQSQRNYLMWIISDYFSCYPLRTGRPVDVGGR